MRTITRMLLLWLCGCCGAAARQYAAYMFSAVPLHAPVPVLHVLSPAPLAVPPHPAHPAHPAPRPLSYTSSVRHTPFTRPYSEPRPYSDSSQYAESRPYPESRPFAGSRPYAESSYAEVRPYAESRPYVGSRPYADSRPYIEAVEYEDAASSDFGRAAHKPRVRPSSTEYAVEFDSFGPRVYPAAAPPRVKPHEASLEVDSAAYSSQEAAPAVLYARPSVSGGYTYRTISSHKSPPKKVPSSKEQPVVVKIHKHKIIKS